MTNERNAGAPANDNADQPIEFGMCKRDNVTEITFVGDVSSRRRFGTTNPDFFHGLLYQIANAWARGKLPDERGVRFMLAYITEGKPHDAIEATILAQKAVCNRAMMDAANRREHAESLEEFDYADRSFNRLARTDANLTDSLLRYRASKRQETSTHNSFVDSGAQTTNETLARSRGNQVERYADRRADKGRSAASCDQGRPETAPGEGAADHDRHGQA